MTTSRAEHLRRRLAEVRAQKDTKMDYIIEWTTSTPSHEINDRMCDGVYAEWEQLKKDEAELMAQLAALEDIYVSSSASKPQQPPHQQKK